jgi:Protein of unknown function (DUF3379)
MMDHAQYRSAVLSDPNDPDPELRAHRESCAECAAYTEKLQGFEARLARALQVEVDAGKSWAAIRGAGRPVTSLARRPPRGWPPRVAGARWLALAASVVFGAVVVGLIWVVPSRSLAAAVVAHMAGEPGAWRTDAPVPGSQLNAVLEDSKLKIMPQAGMVSYASSCRFRGHMVPHLVVQSDSGPVTVMVLVHESKAKWKQFDEQGYRGVIVPVQGHGALAILMKDPHADAATVARVAAKVRESIVWTPGLDSNLAQ